MPPAIQNLPVAPPAAVKKKPRASGGEAAAQGPQFERELAGSRKPQRAAEEEQARPAAKKAARAGKVKKDSPVDAAAEAEATEAGDGASPQPTSAKDADTPAVEAEPADELPAGRDVQGGEVSEGEPEGAAEMTAVATLAAAAAGSATPAPVANSEREGSDGLPDGAEAVTASPQEAAPPEVFAKSSAGRIEFADDLAAEAASSDRPVLEAAARAVPAGHPDAPESVTPGGARAPATPEADTVQPPVASLAHAFESLASPAFAQTNLTTPDVHAGTPTAASPAPAAPDAALPEAQFAEANHENIVKGMRAEVLPRGGTMRIRLDPPQLGALQVTVHVRDGVVTAAFETSSDEATRLLGHSLNHLKGVLESHGVSVEKLQVQQSPREEQPSAQRDSQHRRGEEGSRDADREHAARHEQQRREMLRRMWRRLSGVQDPIDLTA